MKLSLADAASRAVERVERALIQATLIDTNGNRTVAAQSLGINRKTLFNKMKTYGLTSDDREVAEDE
jgi:DNA-binding NtrC family response regulator